jgi:hypothetical protein
LFYGRRSCGKGSLTPCSCLAPHLPPATAAATFVFVLVPLCFLIKAIPESVWPRGGRWYGANAVLAGQGRDRKYHHSWKAMVRTKGVGIIQQGVRGGPEVLLGGKALVRGGEKRL